MYFIVSEQLLGLEIQFTGRSKEEGKIGNRASSSLLLSHSQMLLLEERMSQGASTGLAGSRSSPWDPEPLFSNFGITHDTVRSAAGAEQSKRWVHQQYKLANHDYSFACLRNFQM